METPEMSRWGPIGVQIILVCGILLSSKSLAFPYPRCKSSPPPLLAWKLLCVSLHASHTLLPHATGLALE